MHIQVRTTDRVIVAYGHFPTDHLDAGIEIVEVADGERAKFGEPGIKVLAGDGTIVVLPPAAPASAPTA